MATFPQPKAYASIGSLQKVRGLAGEIIVKLTYPRLELTVPRRAYVCDRGSYLPVTLTHWEPAELYAVTQLKEAPDRESALKIRGLSLFVAQDELASLLEGSCFALVGYAVHDTTHGLLGHVVDVIDRSMQPLLEISQKNKQVYIPFHDTYFLAINEEEKRIDVSLPEAFLD